jgi:MurNAc alpha-1-phosphate uridylyltransferase
MSKTAITDFSAFILAAGEGRRLRPYTDHIPKPMVVVGGRPIIAHTLSHLQCAQVPRVVINTYYKAEVIGDFINIRQEPPPVILSKETTLLNTGLGIKKALHHMGNNDFFVINGDAFWTHGQEGNVFQRLYQHWRPEDMDILILLQPVAAMLLTRGVGDYDLEPDGRAVRRKDKDGAYMFAGIRICKPSVFEGTPDTPFSFLGLMDKAEEKRRLYGLVHDGDWHHISTPQDLERVNTVLMMGEEQKEAAG